MGIIDKDGAMYLATGVDTTGLLEGKREVLEILKTMMRETASLDVFSDIELAAATAFTRAAADTYELSRAFEYNMQTVATLSPAIATSLGDYENQVIGMTRTIPVAADDCAEALYRIVTAGYNGGEAMKILEQAAREAVVASTGVADAFARMQESGGDMSAWTESFSALDYSDSMAALDSQLQLLQNNILAVTRKMGDEVTRQVANVATRLGDALSDGRVEKSFRSLDTLITLASAALADYREEVGEATGRITAESAALKIASGVRQAYHEVVENGIVQREAEVQQQQTLQASLAESQALEAQGGALKDQLYKKSADVINLFAQEDAMYWRKITDVRELLASQQQELAMDNEALASAGKLLDMRKEEFEVACKGADLSKIEIANTNLQNATKQKEAATIEVANMKRKVEGTQIRLNTLERRGESAAIAGNAVAINAESASNTVDTVTTGILTKAKQRLTLVTLALGRAMMANPIGLVLSVVSLAISAFSMFGKKTEDTASAVDKLNESLDKQKERSSNLVNTLYDENESYQKRVAALLELRKLYPEVWDKVNLANLGEQERNKLIKEGNELLEKKRIKELEVKKAQEERMLAYWKEEAKKEVTTYTKDGFPVKGPNYDAIDNAKKSEQSLKEYNKELEIAYKLEAASARERMTKEDYLVEYNEQLRVLTERLEGIQKLRKQLDKEEPGGAAAEDAKRWEEEVKAEIQNTLTAKDELNKPKPLSKEERESIRNDINKTKFSLKLKYEKEAEEKSIAIKSEGREKRIAQVNLEYKEKGQIIEKEEKELLEKYKKLGINSLPIDDVQMFGKQKAANEEEKNKKIQEINEQNAKEVDSHRKEMAAKVKPGYVATQEESDKKGISDRYEQERGWVTNQVENKGMPQVEADKYNKNITLAEHKEQHARLLAELNDYNQKRQQITAEWDAKIKTAENEAKLSPDQGGNDDLEKRLEEEKQKSLSALGTEELMQSEEWTNLFDNLDELTIAQIDKLMEDIQTKMGEVQGSLGASGAKINVVDMKAITGKLNEAKQKIATLNPFRAMGDSMKDVFGKGADEAGDASQEIGDKWKNLGKSTKGCFEFVNDAVGSCNVLSDVIGESGQQTMGMIQGVATAGIMMAGALKNVEKGSVVLAVISAALMAVNALSSLFNKDKKQEKKIQRLQGQIDDLEHAYDRLGTAMENTYSDEVYQMMDDQNDNLREQQELIKQQIEAEDKKKKTDKKKIKDWQNELVDIDEKIKENERKQIEMLAGTDVQSAIDSFADALTEAYAKGEDGAEALGATTKKVMANAVKESLKKKFLGDAINDAVNFLGNAMGDGVLTEAEQAQFEEMVQKGGENFTKAMDTYQNMFRDADGAMSEGVTGQLQAAMTEGTASQLVGLWNTTASDVRAIREWLLTGVAIAPESPFDMTRMIDLQNEIAVNTRATAQSTTATMYELRDGLGRMNERLGAIEMNTRGYAGRGR